MERINKIVGILIVSVLVLCSCSNEKRCAGKLLRKTVDISENGTSDTTLYKYKGNEILSAEGNEKQVVYTYQNDFITRIVIRDKQSQRSVTLDYTYDESKLIRMKSSENYVMNYIHNTDGTVSYEKVAVDSQNHEVNVFHGILRFLNENLKNDDRILDNVGVGILSEYSLSFEYDTKINPFQNILGFDKLLDRNEGISINNNLITMVTSSIAINDQITSSANFYKNSFKYDADNYPTEQVSEASISDKGYLKVHYFYD